MFAAVIYRPAEWRDFFFMLGGAAAALTGLVFVALALNVNAILGDRPNRLRSIGTLTNFGGIFVICSVALMGDQTHVTIGITWLLVSIVAGFVYVRVRIIAPTPSRSELRPRFLLGSALYLGQVVGSIVLLSGIAAGLYLAGASMTLLEVYSVTGAWLLVLGASDVL
jgi:modulator of FtsH protease